MKPDIKEIVKRLKKLIVYLGMSTSGSKQDIANVLGLSPSALSKAINRNSIPYEKLYLFSRKNMISLDWLLDGIDINLFVGQHNNLKYELIVFQSINSILNFLMLSEKEKEKFLQIDLVNNINESISMRQFHYDLSENIIIDLNRLIFLFSKVGVRLNIFDNIFSNDVIGYKCSLNNTYFSLFVFEDIHKAFQFSSSQLLKDNVKLISLNIKKNEKVFIFFRDE